MAHDAYAVIGNPVAHSLSPPIHAAFADQFGHELTYTKIFAAIDGFAEAVKDFRDKGGKGMNVTLPFKEQARQLSTDCSERAQQAGAVNTLSFNADGSVRGDITDGVGLVRDICVNHQLSLQNRRIALLGAGGAVRGVLGDLLAEDPESILIVNRTLERALAIVTEFASDRVRTSSYAEMSGQRFDVIINGTAASLGGAVPPLPDAITHAATFCYDMVYARSATAFMGWASSQGVTACSDGLGMLVEQAAEAFFIWRGVRPDTAPVIKWLREQLQAAA